MLMWLLLLDRSSSMADPFRGTGEFAGRTRTTEAASKLAAAKDAIWEHLLGLGSEARVVIVAFNHQANVVFDGLSSDHTRIRACLDGIDAGGNTDIAAALTRALQAVKRAPNERVFRTLVVSDGLSDL